MTALNAADRISREREFHNTRFSDDSERVTRTARFYSAIEFCFDYFRERIYDESSDRRVLEYGCGTESFALDLAPSAREVVSIDISEVAIEQAIRLGKERNAQNVHFVVDNAEAMQFPDRSMDVIAGSGIIHHLDIDKSMREVKRVLRPGGVAIFAEPLGHNPILNWYRNRTPELRTPDEHPLKAADLRKMRKQFAVSRVRYFGLVSPVLGFFYRKVDFAQPLPRFVRVLDRIACSIPGLRRFAWFSVIELQA